MRMSKFLLLLTSAIVMPLVDGFGYASLLTFRPLKSRYVPSKFCFSAIRGNGEDGGPTTESIFAANMMMRLEERVNRQEERVNRQEERVDRQEERVDEARNSIDILEGAIPTVGSEDWSNLSRVPKLEFLLEIPPEQRRKELLSRVEREKEDLRKKEEVWEREKEVWEREKEVWEREKEDLRKEKEVLQNEKDLRKRKKDNLGTPGTVQKEVFRFDAKTSIALYYGD